MEMHVSLVGRTDLAGEIYRQLRQAILAGAPAARPPRACVTPSHQFPLGMAMSLPRRMAVLAWAQRHARGLPGTPPAGREHAGAPARPAPGGGPVGGGPAPDRHRPHRVLAYGAIPTDRIDEGLDRLRRCFDP